MSNIQVQRESNIKTMFANKTKMIQSILGDKKKADKFTATAVQVALSKDLSACTEESIVNCAIGVAMLDLSLDKNIGQAYLIKYGQECTLQVGYKGWIDLLYRSGYEVRTFPVFKIDDFSVTFDGWDMNYKLNPNLKDRDIGNFEWEFQNLDGIIVASKDLTTKEIKRDFISKATIEKMRKSSPNQKTDTPSYIWKDWYIDMCSKSAIKKFKNQLAIRSNEQQLSIVDMVDNHKKIDFESTKEKGIIIESTPAKEEKKDINQLQQNQVNSFDLLLKEMTDNGIDEQKSKEFLNSNSDKLELYLKDKDTFFNDCINLVL